VVCRRSRTAWARRDHHDRYGPGVRLAQRLGHESARPVEERPVADRSQGADQRQPEGAFAAEGQFHGRLLHRGGVEEDAESERHENGDQRAGGCPPPALAWSLVAVMVAHQKRK
jgi:hypothetical protein